MSAEADPLALIIGGGGACIGALSMIVWTMLLSQVKQLRTDLKETSDHLIGSDGMTVKLTEIRGRLNTAEAEIAALKHGTLSKEFFERETRAQNEKLEGIKEQTKVLDHKVDKIDRTLMPPPRSYSPPENKR